MILSALFFSFASRGDVTFEKADLKIKDKIVHAKIADTEERREHGLMFVKSLGANEGMIFVFENPRVLSFWMKNTLIPLSIGFFDDQGILIDVKEMKPAPSLMDKNPPNYQSSGPAVLALEMPQGWFSKNHVEVGASIALAGATKSALLKQKIRSSARQTSSGHSH